MFEKVYESTDLLMLYRLLNHLKGLQARSSFHKNRISNR